MTSDEFSDWYNLERERLIKMTFAIANRKCNATWEDAEDGLTCVALQLLKSNHKLQRIKGKPLRMTYPDGTEGYTLVAYIVKSALNAAQTEKQRREMRGAIVAYPDDFERNMTGIRARKPSDGKMVTTEVVLHCWEKLCDGERSSVRRKLCGFDAMPLDRTGRRQASAAREKLYECFVANGLTAQELLLVPHECHAIFCGTPDSFQPRLREVSP